MHQQARVIVPGGRSNSAADGLDDQARDVGGDEEDGIEARREAAQGAVQGLDDIPEGEIQTGADEGGAQHDGDNLQLEGVAVPDIVGEDAAADVAGAFEDAAGADGDGAGDGG